MTESNRVSKVCEGCQEPVNQCRCKEDELPTAAIISQKHKMLHNRATLTEYGEQLEDGEELKALQDVQQLIKDRIEKHEEVIEKNPPDRAISQRQKTKISALEEVLEEVQNQ